MAFYFKPKVTWASTLTQYKIFPPPKGNQLNIANHSSLAQALG